MAKDLKDDEEEDGVPVYPSESNDPQDDAPETMIASRPRPSAAQMYAKENALRRMSGQGPVEQEFDQGMPADPTAQSISRGIVANHAASDLDSINKYDQMTKNMQGMPAFMRQPSNTDATIDQKVAAMQAMQMGQAAGPISPIAARTATAKAAGIRVGEPLWTAVRKLAGKAQTPIDMNAKDAALSAYKAAYKVDPSISTKIQELAKKSLDQLTPEELEFMKRLAPDKL